MTGRRSHGRLSALNGVVHQGTPRAVALVGVPSGSFRRAKLAVGDDEEVAAAARRVEEPQRADSRPSAPGSRFDLRKHTRELDAMLTARYSGISRAGNRRQRRSDRRRRRGRGLARVRFRERCRGVATDIGSG